MKVQWFTSATVGIQSASGSRVLCDPWLTDGAFIGSWYHWPPLEGDEYARVLGMRWDAVYVSHLHADHCDRRFLAELARAQPKCQAIIPASANPWLERIIRTCGFTQDRLQIVQSGHKTVVGDIGVRVWSADTCNPALCGVSVPCHGLERDDAVIDSLAVFEADGQRLLNANDALSVASVSRVLNQVGQVDLILGHFGGAGPYPQCFSDLSSEAKHIAAESLALRFVERLADASKLLKARYVFPFAGQYFLSGRLVPLNQYRSVLPLGQVLSLLVEKTTSIPLSLGNFHTFDLSTEEVSGEWREPSAAAVSEYAGRLEPIRFSYELAYEEWHHFERDLLTAGDRMQAAFKRHASFGKADCSLILCDETDRSVTFDFVGKDFHSHVGVQALSPNVTTITADQRLWRRLVVRRPGYRGFTPMHFNQAEIGSHLSWKREGQYRTETRFLNFLQT